MSHVTATIEQKRDRLLEVLAGYGRVAVAFSAGVDSTVVARAAHLPWRPLLMAPSGGQPARGRRGVGG